MTTDYWIDRPDERGGDPTKAYSVQELWGDIRLKPFFESLDCEEQMYEPEEEFS